MTESAPHDALIIGGGPAGLATANALARQHYRAVVFDNGHYRNARASHMHNVLGWDHQPPSALRAKAKDDILKRYKTIEFENVAVKSVRKTETGIFQVTDGNNKTWPGRKLVLASGSRDIPPEIPGYEECWGYSIFACLFCHGYEESGVPSAAVLAAGPMAGKMYVVSQQARRFADKVTIYTNNNADMTVQMEQHLAKDKDSATGRLCIDSRAITRLERGKEHESQIILTFADGTTATEGFMAHVPETEPNGPFVTQLGLELGDLNEIKVTPPFNETSVAGCFAAGDAATFMKAVAVAGFMGATCGAGVAMQLGNENFAVRE